MRLAPVLLAIGILLIPSCASVQEDDAIPEEAIALEDVDVAELQELAEQGNAGAQKLLGDRYREGSGVAQDYEEAVRWYRLAAEQGYPEAQFRLGAMYATGDGVTEDAVRAYMWYNLAVAQGEESARGGSRWN